MYEVLLATFAIGIFTKFTDLIVDDELKLTKSLAYVSGIVYGVLIAYVLANYPLLAPLGFAIVIAVLLTKKIDGKPHILGVVTMLLFLGLWGFPWVDVILLAVFLAAGVVDEIASDLADKGKVRGMPAKVLEKRIVLEITVLSVSIVTGYWIIFLGILSYDVGYLLIGRTGKWFK